MGEMQHDSRQPEKFKSLNSQLARLHESICTEIPQIVRVSFAIYDQMTDHLKTYADSTPKGEILIHYEYPLSKIPSLKECAEQNTNRYINNLYKRLEKESHHNNWLRAQNFSSSFASPTYYNGDFIGFIFINASEDFIFDESSDRILAPYLEQIREAVLKEYQIIHAILKETEEILQRNPKHFKQAKDHQERMYFFTKVIAQGLTEVYQLDDEQIDFITLFSRLHDIGKLSLPCDLLTKPGALASLERKQVTGHIEKGVEIINKILPGSECDNHACIAILKDIMAYHHELMDGSGYPHRLKGQDIPVSARIITVANIFDALTSHRPYKQARSVPFALLELEKMVAEQKLDRHCVNALRNNQEYLKKVIEKYPEPDPSSLSDTYYT
ncbi:Cyclic di-GMP phosphodiesterase response regulator RpfG [Vibrio aerogenes CECT 7868]|uniref:Cyclic di-GMP phosphodiesterase response regulator RpfG n=1 Tax=Vibrio aerogenes CECT 7868 TaxID=1216006 RepID=A0A1M5WM25_9VIBR|nr:HD domain-containing phosphohydrolase [Vibrio aerogenes]SHH88549.1 Cyclic di-GMP phosphodiesterase response regulator RpfG [Vibrio aerogenes CECT 7868]